jgi:serine protease DegS
MTEEGYLLTCYHVVNNAESIEVRLQDGRTLEAQLVGVDIHTDLAVLKVDEPNLPVIPQIEETRTKVGDLVMAIGNPLNLGQTITQGIISATGRFGLSNYTDYIQMDAVLNEGSSGGALIDSNGALIGINNSNFKTLDGRNRVTDVAGVFFAVPYELAKRVMDKIIKEGRVVRSHIGISGDEFFYAGNIIGIQVSAIQANGPADLANIQVGDVLRKISDEPIISAHQMQDIIAETAPGTEISVTLIRGDKLYETKVALVELPSSLR